MKKKFFIFVIFFSIFLTKISFGFDMSLENTKEISKNALNSIQEGYKKAKDKTQSGFNTVKNKTKRGYINVKTKLKKPEEIIPDMVQTSQEWEIQAQNVPLNERELKDYVAPSSTKRNYIPRPTYVFERYNYPQGKRELDLSTLKKNLTYLSPIITDAQVTKGAWVEYYFAPESNQISSAVFVENLDTSRGKKDRVINFKIEQEERIPIVEAGVKEIYQNLFNGLSIVDFNNDGTKLLIKEKVGSTFGGIYKTYLYVNFISDDYTIKLYDLDDTIKSYYRTYEHFNITNYRYDIEPLGFSAADDNIIILLCNTYDKQGQKVFMGTWAYDVNTREVMLLSKTPSNNYVSANGLILKQVVY